MNRITMGAPQRLRMRLAPRLGHRIPVMRLFIAQGGRSAIFQKPTRVSRFLSRRATARSNPVRSLIAQSNGFAGGHRRGAIYRVILWAFCHGLICGTVHGALVANFHGAGVGLGRGGRGAPDHHDLSVADGGDDGQALLALLCVSGRRTVPGALAAVGADHPLRGAVGARGEPIVLIVDDSTKKKAGRQIEGVGHYRNGAGSARQEYRTLRGLNFVWGIMRVPLPCWPGQSVSVPIGLSLYLKEEQARQLKLPYQSRSALAREIVDFVAAQLPARPIRVLGDGGYATKDYLHQLPATVNVVGRMLITGKLYARPPQPRGPRRGCPPKKGPLLGSPKTFARKRSGWQPHPTEAGALVQAWTGCGIPSCRDA